jgi:hypothetical protein
MYVCGVLTRFTAELFLKRNPYTEDCCAVPINRQRLYQIPGPPDLARLPAGCPFARETRPDIAVVSLPFATYK